MTRWSFAVIALVACGGGGGDEPAREEVKRAPAPPAPAAGPATCDGAASHWADYLHNNVKSARATSDWKGVRTDLRRQCEREKWPEELRDCWAKISGVSTHETCVAMRKKLRP